MTDHDPLLTNLRAQARDYDPPLPAGTHRRIIESLANAPVAPARRSILPYLLIGGTLVAASILAIVLRPHPVTPTPRHTGSPLVRTPPTPPHPITLAQRYIDDPLEREYRAIVTDLTRAANTLTNVLPSAKPNAG
jgi:hypothetical protein